jgi:hypothetical protein
MWWFWCSVMGFLRVRIFSSDSFNLWIEAVQKDRRQELYGWVYCTDILRFVSSDRFENLNVITWIEFCFSRKVESWLDPADKKMLPKSNTRITSNGSNHKNKDRDSNLVDRNNFGSVHWCWGFRNRGVFIALKSKYQVEIAGTQLPQEYQWQTSSPTQNVGHQMPLRPFRSIHKKIEHYSKIDGNRE